MDTKYKALDFSEFDLLNAFHFYVISKVDSITDVTQTDSGEVYYKGEVILKMDKNLVQIFTTPIMDKMTEEDFSFIASFRSALQIIISQKKRITE